MQDFVPNLAYYEAKSNPILQLQSDAIRLKRNHKNYYNKIRPVLCKERWNLTLQKWQQESFEEIVLYQPRCIYSRVT